MGLGDVTTVLVIEAITHNEDHIQLGLKSSWSPPVKTRAREYGVKDNGGIERLRDECLLLRDRKAAMDAELGRRLLLCQEGGDGRGAG